jgi:hypothetical protein
MFNPYLVATVGFVGLVFAGIIVWLDSRPVRSHRRHRHA